ncbi:MAG: hypothetical protein ACRDYC_05560 [Acidimicrobiales bacterium]
MPKIPLLEGFIIRPIVSALDLENASPTRSARHPQHVGEVTVTDLEKFVAEWPEMWAKLSATLPEQWTQQDALADAAAAALPAPRKNSPLRANRPKADLRSVPDDRVDQDKT